MELLKTFSPSFFVWQLLSLCPFSFDRKTYRLQTRRLHKIIFAGALVILILPIVRELFDYDLGVLIDDEYEDIDDSVTSDGIFVPFVALVIVTESWLKRDKQIEYLKVIDKIDRILLINLRTRNDYKEEIFRQQHMFECRMLLSFCLGISRFVAAIYLRSWELGVSVLISLMPVQYEILHYHRIDAFVDMINQRYRIINQFIENTMIEKKTVDTPMIVQQQRKPPRRIKACKTISDYAQAQHLDNIRKVHNLLLDANDILRKAFTWSTPFCFLLDFQRMFIALVWLCLTKDLFSHVQLYMVLLEVMLKTCNFVSLLNTCEATITKVIS